MLYCISSKGLHSSVWRHPHSTFKTNFYKDKNIRGVLVLESKWRKYNFKWEHCDFWETYFNVHQGFLSLSFCLTQFFINESHILFVKQKRMVQWHKTIMQWRRNFIKLEYRDWVTNLMLLISYYKLCPFRKWKKNISHDNGYLQTVMLYISPEKWKVERGAGENSCLMWFLRNREQCLYIKTGFLHLVHKIPNAFILLIRCLLTQQ